MALYLMEKNPSLGGGTPTNMRIRIRGRTSLSETVLLSPEELMGVLPERKQNLSKYFLADAPIGIVTHPVRTWTCREKICALGWPHLHDALKRTIKCVVFQHKDDGKYHFFIIPGKPDGRFIHVQSVKDVPPFGAENSPKRRLRIVPEHELPWDMKDGTCTPFLPPEGKSRIGGIFFDKGHLEKKRTGFDDLSVAIGFPGMPDHHLSVFMNYSDLFARLRELFGEELVHAVKMQYEKKELKLERFKSEGEGIGRFFSGIEHVLAHLRERKIQFEILQTNIIPSDGKWFEEQLGLSARNFLKGVYYRGGNDLLYGLIFPSTDFEEVTNFSTPPGRYYDIFDPMWSNLADYHCMARKIELPEGMYYDALSPFPNSEARNEVRRVALSMNCDFKDDEMVGVSLGLAPGYPLGQKVTLLLPFGALKEIVGEKFEVRSDRKPFVYYCRPEEEYRFSINAESWGAADAVLLEMESEWHGYLEELRDAIRWATEGGIPVFIISNALDEGINTERLGKVIGSGAIPLGVATKKMAYYSVSEITKIARSTRNPEEIVARVREALG